MQDEWTIQRACSASECCRKVTADKVLEDLKGVGGKVLRTSFDHSKREALHAALAAASEAAPKTEQAA
jgi:uncharacterized membrane protein